MPRSLRILVTGLAFLGYSLVGAFIGYVAMPLSLLGARDPATRARRARAALGRWCARFAWLIDVGGLIRVHPSERLARLRLPEPAIIVANHPSLLDVIVLLSVLPGMTLLVKASWFRSPFIGRLLRLGDHIPAGVEQSPADGATVVDRILERLAAGSSVLLFPEGTRSPERGLGEFRRGAFEAARRTGVPLVVLAVHIDPPTLMRGQAWYEVPARRIRYDLDVLDVVTAREDESSRALCERVKETYRRALNQAG